MTLTKNVSPLNNKFNFVWYLLLYMFWASNSPFTQFYLLKILYNEVLKLKREVEVIFLNGESLCLKHNNPLLPKIILKTPED